MSHPNKKDWFNTEPLYLSSHFRWNLYPPSPSNLLPQEPRVHHHNPVTDSEFKLSKLLGVMKTNFQKSISFKDKKAEMTMESVLKRSKLWFDKNTNLFKNPEKFDSLFTLSEDSTEFDVDRHAKLYGFRSRMTPDLYRAVNLRDQAPLSIQDMEDMNVWMMHLKRIIPDFDAIRQETSVLETLIFDSSLLPRAMADKKIYISYLSAYAIDRCKKADPLEIEKIWMREKQFSTDRDLLKKTRILENDFVAKFNAACPNDVTATDLCDLQSTSSTVLYNPTFKKYMSIDFGKSDQVNFSYVKDGVSQV